MKLILSTLSLLFIFNTSQAADLYIYPNNGQNQESQRVDRYECHTWAAQQTGFDPSTYHSPTPVHHASVSKGHHHPDINPVTGAASGAAMGAVGGAIGGNAGKGAAIGAGVGALAGAFYTLLHQDHKSRHKKHLAYAATVDVQQLRSDYNRAISACLESRGYTVK